MYDVERILVAIDFSQPSTVAFERAIEIAQRFGADLHVAHAFASPMVLYGPYEGAVPQSFLREARLAAAEKLEQARAKAEAAGITAQSHLLSEPVATEIRKLAEELDISALVVGTHGHTGLRHALLGSVAERIIRHAPCDVWVVRDQGSDTSKGEDSK